MRNTRTIGRRISTTKAARVKSVAPQQPQAQPSHAQPQPAPLTPSVPMAIYRELSADLQAARANYTALRAENQQLATQNQKMRQDLEQLAAQTQEILKKLQHEQIDTATAEAILLDELGFDAESAQTRSQMLDQLYRAMPSHAPAHRLHTDGAMDSTAVSSSGMAFSRVPKFNLPKINRPNLVYEQAQNPLQLSLSARDHQLSGWKLILMMALIVFSAFGAGFLIVRPLMAPNSNR
jgi:hypothetical protein